MMHNSSHPNRHLGVRASGQMTSRLPKLVAFDLEYAHAIGPYLLYEECSLCRDSYSYTLWDLWIDTHVDRMVTPHRYPYIHTYTNMSL